MQLFSVKTGKKFVPRWFLWVLPFFLVWSAIFDVTSFNLALILGAIGFVIVGMAAQLYRYFRVSFQIDGKEISLIAPPLRRL
jgi:hypothetical protein